MNTEFALTGERRKPACVHLDPVSPKINAAEHAHQNRMQPGKQSAVIARNRLRGPHSVARIIRGQRMSAIKFGAGLLRN